MAAARAAVRDVLYLYYDAVTDYGGFGHALEIGSFDPLTYLDAVLEPSWSTEVDLTLLHEGSAVALLCILSGFWDERESCPGDDGVTQAIREALLQGRLEHLPVARDAVVAGFESREALDAALPHVYRAHVVDRLRGLAAEAEKGAAR